MGLLQNSGALNEAKGALATEAEARALARL